MACAVARNIRRFLVACGLCMLAAPLAAQDRYLRLDDGLYELNADGTYHKVEGATASSPRPSSSSSRPATSSSSGQFTGQERFIRFDDGLYERMADGTYTKADERRLTQSQSQSGRYGSSSTSSDPRWQQQFGRQDQWDNQPEQWFDGRPQQWSNNGRPPQWNNNVGPQQWNNNVRPQQWNHNRPPATDSMLMDLTGQEKQPRSAPKPMMQQGQRRPRPQAVDPMLMDSTGQGVNEHAEVDPWYELGRSIRGVIDAEAQGGRSRP